MVGEGSLPAVDGGAPDDGLRRLLAHHDCAAHGYELGAAVADALLAASGGGALPSWLVDHAMGRAAAADGSTLVEYRPSRAALADGRLNAVLSRHPLATLVERGAEATVAVPPAAAAELEGADPSGVPLRRNPAALVRAMLRETSSAGDATLGAALALLKEGCVEGVADPRLCWVTCGLIDLAHRRAAEAEGVGWWEAEAHGWGGCAGWGAAADAYHDERVLGRAAGGGGGGEGKGAVVDGEWSGAKPRYHDPSGGAALPAKRAARPEEIFAQLLECAVREADPADGWPRENLGRSGGLAALM